ncbi:helix-turn-helix domain-containing protein [Halorarum salinum]|uniref:MarR family transcriptional regulator n=1 Tax=Halorarum salinum TaxID=2743089 RepID=A0A7D5QC56_9EURY|nr:helix-turn-helix domain-containing protein [Halobaculum salinum]QLG63098.1 MarR family transcriptional regulator [Halobaculum salinum]
MTADISRDDVDDLPPSCKYVLDVLEREGELSRQKLLDRTGLPERTLDWALGTLNNRGYIFSAQDNEDLRVVLYNIQR